MAVALYAGSFDPIHRGHLAVVELASAHFERVVVVVAANPRKRDALFTPEQRRALIEQCVRHLGNVEVITHAGLIVAIAGRVRADFLLRAIGKEQRDEFEMAAMNLQMSGIPTLFVAPPAATAHIASRLVRDRFAAEGVAGIRALVPVPVATALAARASVKTSPWCR
jgi:pantetheine-phosphate adenylyltransferase